MIDYADKKLLKKMNREQAKGRWITFVVGYIVLIILAIIL